MKTILIFCSLLLYVNIYSQSMPNAKATQSGTNPLHKPNIVQSQLQMDVQTDSITYKLNFQVADLSLQNTSTNAQPNTCLLTDANGNIYHGILTSSTTSKAYSCSFLKDDINKISIGKIIQFEILAADGSGGVFATDKKLQSSILEQCEAILTQ